MYRRNFAINLLSIIPSLSLFKSNKKEKEPQKFFTLGIKKGQKYIISDLGKDGRDIVATYIQPIRCTNHKLVTLTKGLFKYEQNYIIADFCGIITFNTNQKNKDNWFDNPKHLYRIYKHYYDIIEGVSEEIKKKII